MSGVYEIKKKDGKPREVFLLPHKEIPGLILCRVEVSAWTAGSYLLATNALFYIDPKCESIALRELSLFEVFCSAVWAVCFKAGDPINKVKLLLKGLVRSDNSYFEDLISLGGNLIWEENWGEVHGGEIVFKSGTKVNSNNFIKKFHPLTAKSLVIYAHHDLTYQFSSGDLESVRALKAVGNDVIIISTSLSESSCHVLEEFAAVISRPNVGHDFVSWKLGISEFRDALGHVENLIFTNNSMMIKTGQTLNELMGMEGPFCCLTDSRQVVHHAESVWWKLDLRLLPFEVIDKFFDQVEVLHSKQAIIKKYEIGFTPFMVENGYTVNALWPYERLVKELTSRKRLYPKIYKRLLKRKTINPSKDLHPILKELGIGLLKKPSKLNNA